jgi:pimeloyl-ACP methyl ester carboxylesterase
MADSINDGVVDSLGQVYNPEGGETYHDGLVVLDGAVIPTALATNPALTIAAVALRAAEALASQWNYRPGAVPGLLPTERPVARDTDVAFEPDGTTEIQICERMSGDVDFVDGNGVAQECVVELTMRFEDLPVSRLYYPDNDHPAELTLDATKDGEVTDSRIRVYKRDDWEEFRLGHTADRSVDDVLDQLAIFSAPLESGTLRVFERGNSSILGRIVRSGWAYLINRGLRDMWQAFFDPGRGPGGLARGWQRVISFFRLTTRAGERRWFHYNLQVGTPDAGSEIQLVGDQIVGRKLFTYKRRANPWRQLMQMELRQFPGIQEQGPRSLELDQQFLMRIGIPLFRITKQADGVTSLAELGSFFAYLSRLLLGIHVWSFRRPDHDLDPAPLNPLPGYFSHIPTANTQILPEWSMGDEVPDGADNDNTVNGNVRLVHYESPAATKPPVVMFHGYSASGTTFAHEAIPNGLAQRLWNSGRDVWVADFRTSAGMDTATTPWSMEQIAYRDVPEVINRVHSHYNDPALKIDVLAHCMGAVMFSMAILADDVDDEEGDVDRRNYSAEQKEKLRELPGLIRRVAFSQVGPLFVFSPANRFRGYVARYLGEMIIGEYSFNPPDESSDEASDEVSENSASLTDQLLDRLLATLPYPEEEYDYENPKWPCKRTPWTRTRHRMDALYGRDFNVKNMSGEMLRHINDHFGALSLKTVSQTMHFARYNTITDRTGYNRFVSRSRFNNARWGFPVFSIHGRDNGLSDVTTVDRMRQILADAGRNYRSYIIEDTGHQDSLIGDGRHAMAHRLIAYFDKSDDGLAPGEPNDGFIALTPWIGPILTLEDSPPIPYLRIGARPSMREPESVVMLRVQIVDNEIRRHDDGMPFDAGDEIFILNNMIIYKSDEFTQNRWDSFPMPLPPAVPASGDALLVLVLYAEAAVLPMASMSYAKFVVGPDFEPFEIKEVSPQDWSEKPWTPPFVDPATPSDETVQEMRRFARLMAGNSLLTLLGQQDASRARIRTKTDPNGVVRTILDDPSSMFQSADPND